MHNKKTYKAKLIGRDPSSDLAVLKIDGNKFPFLLYGNTDRPEAGPVGAGSRLSAYAGNNRNSWYCFRYGRTININRRQTAAGESPIESFIQTDAAVNQGNSGGALGKHQW
jgi:serine protease Do